MTITMEHLQVVLVLVGIGVLGALLVVLLKVNDILKQAKSILVKNDGNINQSIESLPKVINNVEILSNSLNNEMVHVGGAIKNIEEITVGVNEEIKHLKGTVRNIEETVEYAAATAQTLTDDILLPIGDILNLLTILKGIFVKEKKKGIFRK
ncbi:hypothetical protein [Alkaliphilus hydrothermalis]|uniref:Archaellum component FlaC n=1 Tax=Alkaliphilus hydrothermalis TaxID=1482730 RepID=A0ABS2NU34_9FIRM|nr:hypothetical protein [Alkaliphilus hydrothermalis]MBM7616292.1 archaellum component FlaC [Alkaliphilus hydrothermalis]